MLKNGFGMGGVIARSLPGHAEADSLVPNSVSSIDEKWMSVALIEAMNGIGWTSPNPSVGCVVVKDQKILARGFTQAYGGKHAERMAFESLQKNYNLDQLSGLQVYVTLEPCSHTGKQPPCVDLLLHPAVSRVIVACTDPNPLVRGSGIKKLKDAGKEVIIGVLENEAQAWHFPFLHFHTHKKPLWVAKWAENQDGVLADADGNSKWITNPRSRAYTHWLRQKYDAILVGARTWLMDQPKLTVRDCAQPHRRNPIILIHDPRKIVSNLTDHPKIHLFQQQTIEELISEVEGTQFGFELQSVFCEGGARTLNELFRVGRIDVVHRFIGEKEFGASKHRITEFNPDVSNASWRMISKASFENDSLQEWLKWS